MNSSFTKIFNKYLPNPQNRKKFKRQCLKAKNIIQQNQIVQIGCRIQKLYDFYTSKNYVQVNIFIGNKMSKPIDRYNVQFKGTQNLSVYLQQKQDKSIKQSTQGKQRVVIQWLPQADNENPSLMLLTMSFSSKQMTLKDLVIPLSLWSFYNFPLSMQQIISPSISAQSLSKTFTQKYELIEDQTISINLGLFRKGFNIKDMQKYFDKLIQLSNKGSSNQSVQQQTVSFGGVFTMKSLLQQIGILIEVSLSLVDPKMKITLGGNEYKYFESIFNNISFLFGK